MFLPAAYLLASYSMFDAVHKMRTRIMTSPYFTGDKILGAILFEDSMDRTVEGLPTCEYLWQRKGIVPFLKIDKGLQALAAVDAEDGNGNGIEIIRQGSVQLLNPIPNLEELLQRAKSLGVYGTKARSLILNAQHPDQIDALVQQQFSLARRVLQAGLIPIIEPEVDVNLNATDKQKCEEILCKALLRELDQLLVEDDNDKDDDNDNARHLLEQPLHQVMIKITLPEVANQYQDCVNHPCCLKVVALSGGYNQEQANLRLEQNKGVIASFSRALAEGLSHSMTNDEFDACLAKSIAQIYNASASASA